ncbi:MAG TPA: FG-GAP repeat protein [Gammaproteobacteria bacterium]|nr:FG-GAP repeat protein [Gammaproteobacteria bacterium]
MLPVGFEQGFTIAKRPSGTGELTLALAMSPSNAESPFIRHSRAGGNPVQTSPSLPLRSERGKEIAWGKLRYGQLVVTDANGKLLPATFRVAQDRDQARPYRAGERILIAVNDAQAVYPLTVDPLVWLDQKVTASDGADSDAFGWSVALSGATALVGAPFATGNSPHGAAYAFSESNGTWTQTAKLTASDGAAYDRFGQSVALDGSTALIGAYEANGYQGAAYVFGESGGNWSQTQELTASDGAAGDQFGYSVALSGNTMLIGSNFATVNGTLWQGAAYVFSESNGSWTQTAKLTASDGAASDNFGSAVALSGATALIGALATVNGNTAQGAAYVFGDSGGSGTQTAKLTASDGAASDDFGNSVALSGAIALIGARLATVNGNQYEGAAYAFGISGGSWTQTAKLTASDGVAFDDFGASVALSGATALIGADVATVNGNEGQGAAYLEGNTNLDLLSTAPTWVYQNDTYLSQAIVTNEATVTLPAVAVTVTVPAAASFVSASAIPGSCGESAGLVTCDFGSIPGRGFAVASINLKATGLPGTTIGNTAGIVKAEPALTAGSPTVITAACPAGYLGYSGLLTPDARDRMSPYQSAAGNQTVLFSASPDFALYVGYQKDAQAKWTIRRISRQAIYHHGPAGTYRWQINAGSDGGAYTLCILHP